MNVYAVALCDSDERARAIALLTKTHVDHPADRDVLVALASYEREAGNLVAARRWAGALVALDPADPGARALLEGLSGVP